MKNNRVATNNYLHHRLICPLFSGFIDLVVWLIKCQKMVKNDNHNFTKFKMQPKMFCLVPTNSPQSKDIELTTIKGKGNIYI